MCYCSHLEYPDLLYRREIPHRDYIMCRVGLILILLLTALESNKKTHSIIESKRFRKIFTTLSSFEVVFTIILPWLIILEGILNQHEKQKNGHLLAAHLFVFQTQIGLECIIQLAGERRKWIMFPLTVFANLYRGVTIATWILMRVVAEEEVLEPRDIVLPLIALCLWLYSSFIFIPHEWYPLLKDEGSSMMK